MRSLLDEAALRDLVREVLREELAAAREAPARPEWVSVADAAAMASVTPDTIRESISRGILPRYKAGRVLRVRRDELEAYLANPRHERARGAVARELSPEELADLDLGRRRGR